MNCIYRFTTSEKCKRMRQESGKSLSVPTHVAESSDCRAKAKDIVDVSLSGGGLSLIQESMRYSEVYDVILFQVTAHSTS